MGSGYIVILLPECDLMMGIGQVLVLKMPPEKLRAVTVAIERGAWDAYETEFYINYYLAKARAAQKLP